MSRFLLSLLLTVLLCTTSVVRGQESMSLEEFLGYVKAFHPLVKQADIKLSESEAKLLKARGAFDPKLAADFNDKTFK